MPVIRYLQPQHVPPEQLDEMRLVVGARRVGEKATQVES